MSKLSSYSDEQLNEELTRRDVERNKGILRPDYRVAEFLHSVLCTANHTDGCGWYYDPISGAHKPWVERAKKLLKITEDENLIMKILNTALGRI